MQRVLVALALGSAAAFAPAAQPRTSVVRFMDEDALKSAASVVIIYSIYHRRGDPMGDALSESALARGATSSTRSMSDALSESALSRDTPSRRNKILNAGPAEFNKIGGVEVATEMPADIKFEVPIPAKVMGRWDGECAITVSEGEMKAGSGNSATVNVVPDSMGYGRVPSLETPSRRRRRKSSARLTVRFTQRTTTRVSRTRPSGSRSSRPSASWIEGAARRRR